MIDDNMILFELKNTFIPRFTSTRHLHHLALLKSHNLYLDPVRLAVGAALIIPEGNQLAVSTAQFRTRHLGAGHFPAIPARAHLTFSLFSDLIAVL